MKVAGQSHLDMQKSRKSSIFPWRFELAQINYIMQ